VRQFDERGYHAVSIADIGEAAGINASSVYAHFASKAELLAAAYYRASSRIELATALVDAAVYVSESENLPPPTATGYGSRSGGTSTPGSGWSPGWTAANHPP
jgi:AcrR family transcriptional regulator